jgi:hypothetical protein
MAPDRGAQVAGSSARRHTVAKVDLPLSSPIEAKKKTPGKVPGVC